MKANILIVDDDAGMIETLSDILSELDYNVEVASDGYKAIELVKTQSFDVILMDIKMPGINGVETFKEIKKLQPGVLVMMMTAYSVEDLISEALSEGAYGIMYKPIDITKVVEFIERVKEGGLILLVDDDTSTCQSLLDVLVLKGFRTAKANTGKEAIKITSERDIDIVIIDVKMPVMNGLETYLALRKIKPDIKAIMMTAYREEVQDLVKEALNKNVYTCIYKPLDISKVVRILEGLQAGKMKNKIQQIAIN